MDEKGENANTITAGIIVIGDEILKGDVTDTNSKYILPKLRNIGVQVKKISIIGDDLNEISNEVREFSVKYTYVITSGGIGPTHDDISYEAVAKAFDEPLVVLPELFKLCCKYYGIKDADSPLGREARVPKSSNLKFMDKVNMEFPLVYVKNVFMFPGIPSLFELYFDHLYKDLFHSSTKFYSRTIYLNISEHQVAEILGNIAKTCPAVTIGCYPICNENFRTKVTLESVKEDSLNGSYERLVKAVPKYSIVNSY